MMILPIDVEVKKHNKLIKKLRPRFEKAINKMLPKGISIKYKD